MTNIFKQFDKLGLVVVLLTLMATIGFKAVNTEATEWYEVTVIDSSLPPGQIELPSNLEIGNFTTAPAPDTDPLLCAEANPSPIPCAIKLSIPANTTKPNTIADIPLTPGVSEHGRAFLPLESR